MKHSLRIVSWLLTVCLLAACLSGCGNQGQEALPPRPTLPPKALARTLKRKKSSWCVHDQPKARADQPACGGVTRRKRPM